MVGSTTRAPSWGPRTRPSVDQRKGLRGAGEHPAAVRDDHDEVLDPHAAAARQVHARLDGDDVACNQALFGAAGQARPLVDLEPDAVAEPVPEALAVAGVGDDRP